MRGFTVIELLVSFTIFAVVLSLVSMVFITSLRSQKSITALIAANDNLYLMLEQMSREIRVGTNFVFISETQLQFDNRVGDTIIYRFVAGSSENPGRILRSASSHAGGSFRQINASNVNIADFFVTNNCGSVGPLRATLHMKVGALGAPNIGGILNDIQTTIATRNLAKCN